MTVRRGTDQLDQQQLNEVLAKIKEIVTVASSGGFIFRGENQVFERVSSGLFRQYHRNRTVSADVEMIQTKILLEAQRFTTERDNATLLSQLQHFESKLTNLIDFTTDYLIALYFACEGAHGSDGRVVLVREENANTIVPTGPSNRVIAQKSIFVRPPSGTIEPDYQVAIPVGLKPTLLTYLNTYHGITVQTIYNDLHGFIHHWFVNDLAFDSYIAGVDQSAKGNYEEAINYFGETLSFIPDQSVYFERGSAYLAISDFENAAKDFALVQRRARYSGDAILSGRASNGLGISLRGQGKHDEAIDIFESALAAYSRTNEPVAEEEEATYSNIVVTLMEKGDFEFASTYATNAQRFGYDPGSRFRADYGDIASFESSNGFCVPRTLAENLVELEGPR